MLEQLARALGATYLSDLTLPLWRPRVYRCIQGLDAQQYPMELWRDTFHYLTGRLCPPHLQQAEEVRAALLEYLGQAPT